PARTLAVPWSCRSGECVWCSAHSAMTCARTVRQSEAITMLAVFEHLGDGAQRNAAAACATMLQSGGRVVLTVPVPAGSHRAFPRAARHRRRDGDACAPRLRRAVD